VDNPADEARYAHRRPSGTPRRPPPCRSAKKPPSWLPPVAQAAVLLGKERVDYG